MKPCHGTYSVMNSAAIYFGRDPTPTPLGSLDILPRLPLPLNQNGGSLIEAYKSRKSHGKIGDCECSTGFITIAFY